MERQLNACQTPRSMYPSIFNSLPVIRTEIVNNRRFHVPQPTFLFPLETPVRLSRSTLRGWKDNSMLAKPLAARTYLSYHAIFAWMERQFNACQTPCSMYLSIFNSFRVIQCLSQCVSPNIAIFTPFLFPLGTPLGQSR